MHKWLCLGMLLWAWPVLAQPHPCDVVPPNNPNLASPLKFGFCVPQTDATVATAYKVYLDANPVPLFTGLLTPTGPNAGGLVYLETPPLTVPQGPHTAQASVLTVVGEGPKSLAYPFGVIGLPVAPSGLRVVP